MHDQAWYKLTKIFCSNDWSNLKLLLFAKFSWTSQLVVVASGCMMIAFVRSAYKSIDGRSCVLPILSPQLHRLGHESQELRKRYDQMSREREAERSAAQEKAAALEANVALTSANNAAMAVSCLQSARRCEVGHCLYNTQSKSSVEICRHHAGWRCGMSGALV